MRPCKCSGTMASVHRVCLERWLNLATSEKCELCGHRYNLRYTSRPFWEDGMGSEPVQAGWEAMVLLGVAVVLVLIYTCWASFTLKYHVKVWRQWRVVHQDVALDCTTPTPRHQSSAQDPESPPTPTTGPAHHARQSHYPLNALCFLPEAAP
uniref:RING-CH-type domain-containing protein n=1 Tax=Scylla olivacea TaxID=85551 RepID=A0A0P4VW77_SCYOL